MVATSKNASNTPEASRRRLRLALREAREATQQTRQDVVRDLHWSLSKVVRIESGAVGISVTDVRALLDQYGVPDSERPRFEELAEGSRSSSSWMKNYGEYFSSASLQLFELERSAKGILKHEPRFIPGLLQTREYAAALVLDLGVSDPAERDAIVEARMERQDLFAQPSRAVMHFIIGEAAVSRPVGGVAAMRRQLAHLVELNNTRDVEIQLIPFAAGIYPKLGESFTILELRDEDANDALYLENAGRDTISIDDVKIISEYEEAFDEIAGRATPAAGLDDHLAKIAKDRFSEAE